MRSSEPDHATPSTHPYWPPRLTIIVPSSGDLGELRHCLATLTSCRNAAAQLIVVRAATSDDLSPVMREFPFVTYLTAPRGTTPGDLRRIGFERGTSRISIFVDDRAVERQVWTSEFCRQWRGWAGSGKRLIATDAAPETPRPALSVVIPMRNAGATLLRALEALAMSDLPRESWEIVVVDDASDDESVLVAAEYADKLVRLPGPRRGPGYARNRGFDLTSGHCVAFINADVMVQSDALRKATELLLQQGDVGAVFGSCEAAPVGGGLISEYRSLAQRHYYDWNADDAITFSSACGVVRSSIFEQAGGYDEWHFSRRQLEDLELAQRIRSLGVRIVQHQDTHALHLRRWTLRRMITTEIFDRAVPWMRLVQRQLTRDDIRGRGRRRVKNTNIALTYLGAIAGILGWHRHSAFLLLAAVACLVVVVVNNAPQLTFFTRERGFPFAAGSVPLDVLYYLISGFGLLLGWIARQAVGDPTPGAATEAFTEMGGAKRWPPVPVKPSARDTTALRVIPGAAKELPIVPEADPPQSLL